MDGGANGNGGASGKGGRGSNPAFREDCWTEEETATLIDAWGERYVALNRGSLRQQHWEEVAAIVNGRHAAGGKRPRRTDVQCKNRIDTIKKKFKQEKAKILSSAPGSEPTKWRFFDRVEFLIGPGGSTGPGPGGSAKKKASPASVGGLVGRASPPVGVPLMLRKAPGEAPPMAQAVKKRPFSAVEDSLPPPRRGFAIPGFNGGGGGFPPPAAMSLKAEEAESDSSRSSSEAEAAEEEEEEEEVVEELDGFRQLAKAIDKFAAMYERVEEAKQKQMFDLEKQRMEFAKALEYQKMQVFVESQVNLEKLKRVRRS